MQQVDAYPFIVRKLPDEEGGGYLVEYPDVRYCIADGKTPEDAVRNGRKALEACLAIMAEFGKRIPPPDSSVQGGPWRQRVSNRLPIPSGPRRADADDLVYEPVGLALPLQRAVSCGHGHERHAEPALRPGKAICTGPRTCRPVAPHCRTRWAAEWRTGPPAVPELAGASGLRQECMASRRCR